MSNRLYKALLKWESYPHPDHDLYARTYGLLSKSIECFDSTANVIIPPSLLKLLSGGEPILIVQLHEGFRFVSRVLSDLKRHFTRVTGRPKKHVEKLHENKIDPDCAHAVEDSIRCFISLRSAVKRKHVICCAIDYANLRGEKVYANPSIIEFANRYNIPVVFVKAKVNADGLPELLYQGPFINPEAQKCTEEFINFFNAHSCRPREITVRPYAGHTDWKKRGRRLRVANANRA